jgi:hypothetical protein
VSALIVQVIADSPARTRWGVALAHGLGTDERPAVVHTQRLAGRTTEPVASVAAGDVMVLATAGGTMPTLLRAVPAGAARSSVSSAAVDRPRRPVVVTGYLGAVPDHKIDGLLLRAGADVLLANSDVAARRFRTILAEHGLGPERVVRTTVSPSGPRYDAGAAGVHRPWTLTLAAPPNLPARRDERRHLFTQAVGYARRHPRRDVVVVLRGRPDEPLAAVEREQFLRLLGPDIEVPANLRCVHESLTEVLGRTDLLVTVGAGPAFEAIRRDIPTAVLTDYGVRAPLGNHVFAGSAVLTSWAAVDAGYRPTPDPRWAADHGLVDAEPFGAVRARIDELLASPLPPLRVGVDLFAGPSARRSAAERPEGSSAARLRLAGPSRRWLRLPRRAA